MKKLLKFFTTKMDEYGKLMETYGRARGWY
jgi:hypothetical protein